MIGAFSELGLLGLDHFREPTPENNLKYEQIKGSIGIMIITKTLLNQNRAEGDIPFLLSYSSPQTQPPLYRRAPF
jgi:hypothetical protein